MIITQRSIQGQPVLEIQRQELAGEEAPLAVFYHGWSNNKVVVAQAGIELARRGFRAVLPDALYHGDYQPKELDAVMDLVPVIEDSVNNFPNIVATYQAQTTDDFVAVAGLSMGGSITNLLMTQESTIDVAASLMSTPASEEFLKFYFSAILSQQERLLSDLPADSLTVKSFSDYDLSLNGATINHRPMYFWHSKDDDWVPFNFAFQAIKALQSLPEGDNIEFRMTEHDGHVVPYKIFVEMADFLLKVYQNRHA